MTLNAKNRYDHDQIWHACADRSGNCPYLKKIGRSWNFRGSKNQKSGKCNELSRKAIIICLTNPTPGDSGGGCGGGGWGSTFQKSGKFHELPRKSIHFFTHPPPKGGRSGNFRGSKNQKSGKCHELPRKVITKK